MGNNVTNIIDDLRLLAEPIPLWWWLIAIAIAVLLYGIGAEILKRRKKAAQTIPQPSESQIEEDALAELEKLRQTMSREQSRVYATLASRIIRRYIERKFSIEAPCRSTEEFLAEAKESKSLTEKDRQLLGDFLNSCDFLKFACAYAEKEELEKLHNLAVDFVKKTSNQTQRPRVRITINNGNLSPSKSLTSIVVLL
ncbi:MAG TPA: hypothetical protein PLW02_04435 [Verrucomicrobiota bacterium]|nr:hypothetical protein [Verrucomicrobiota bacterium]